jgi:two-component system chemotaxis response regulator CheB
MMNVERVVVIGASAGGVAVLESLVRGLPKDFAAAVFVVLHLGATQKSILPALLDRAGPLRASEARDGEPLQTGRVYVAVADHHVMVEANRVRVVRGPRENHFRPSIDVLFRSAAYYFGSRAIGVVLSGSLSDGSSGLHSIRRLGGIAVIQDPEEALFSSMPLSAMRRVDIDYALPVDQIGPLLAGLIGEPTRAEPLDASHYRKDLKFEIDIAAADSAFQRGIMEHAEPSVYTCPDCAGVLFRIREGKIDRFRCHTGHAFTTAALLDQQTESAEEKLWESVRSLQESIALLYETAARLRQNGDDESAKSLTTQAEAVEARLDTLRQLALSRAGLSEKPGESTP